MEIQILNDKSSIEEIRNNSKNKAIEALKEFRNSITKDQDDFLKSLIDLDVSVFDREDLDDLFKDTNLYEVAKHNIIWRAEKLFDKSNIDSDRLIFTINGDSFSFRCTYDDDTLIEPRRFSIYSARLGKQSFDEETVKKPVITICKAFENDSDIPYRHSLDYIERLNRELEIAQCASNGFLNLKKRKNERIIEGLENRINNSYIEFENYINEKYKVVEEVSKVFSKEYKLPGNYKDIDSHLTIKKPWIDIKRYYS